MDVVLGVAVTGPVARLALVGSGAQGADVIDQSVVDLADNPIERLTETVVGTNRLLADENHRLVATRLCWPDTPQADRLRQALEHSGVHDVAVLSESQAVRALMRAAGRAGGVLVVDDETATLSVVGSGGDQDAPPTLLARQPLAGGPGADATAALDTMLARLDAQPGAPRDVYLVGASPNLTRIADQLRDASTMRVEVPDDPTFALARGAAMAAASLAAPAALIGDATAMAPAAALTGDETAFAPAAEAGAEEPQLAYSMADEGEPFGMDEFGEFGEFEDAEAATGRMPLSRKSLVLGNAVIAFAVIGFASLAAALVIAVRPTASQQPVVGHQNAAPGKFMPLLPTQQQAPVPPPPPEAPDAGFQGGTLPAPTGGGAVPQQPPAVGGPPPVAPVPVGPETPGTPGFVPNPNPGVPIPVPIIIPFPGWRPPYPNPYPNPYPPPTPPTTSYTPPPTTTHAPPTTSYTPPTTTTHAPPTTSYTPPTTTQAPTTTQVPTTTPPETSKTTVPTTATPTPSKTPTQQTIPPQTHTQQPVIPQQPHTRHGF